MIRLGGARRGIRVVGSSGGGIASLEFHVQPGDAVAGSQFGTQPVVRALDGMGAVVTGFTGSVIISIHSGDGSLAGTTIQPMVAGVLAYTDLEIDNGSGTHVLRAQIIDLGIFVDSASFVVSASANMVLDFSGQTPTSLLTTAILSASKVGGNDFTFAYSLGPSHGGAAMDRTTLETDGSAPTYPVPFSVNGTPYDGNGDLIVLVDQSTRTGDDGKWEGWTGNFGGDGAQNITVCGFYKFGSVGGSGDSFLDQVAINGGAYVVMQQRATAPTVVRTGLIHTDGNGGGVYGLSQVLPDVWYRFDLRFRPDTGYGELLFRTTDGVIVLASRNPTAMTEFSDITLQDYLSVYGGNTKYKSIVVALGDDATMPLGPCVVADPTSVVAVQATATTATVTWGTIKLAFTWKVEQQVNGGAWTTASASQDTLTFTATGLSTGDTITFRITSLVDSFSSAAADSNTVTMVAAVVPVPDILRWKCNDGSGTTLTATVGPDGTTNGGWSGSTPSGSGSCVTLNGLTQYIQSSATVNYASSQVITFSLWCFFTNTTSLQWLFESGANISSDANVFNAVLSAGVIELAIVSTGAGGDATIFFDIAAPSSSAWHMLTFVLDNTVGSLVAYVDGSTVTVTPAGGTHADAAAFATRTLNIGSRNGGTLPLGANIDDVCIFSGALTGPQVQALFDAGAQ